MRAKVAATILVVLLIVQSVSVVAPVLADTTHVVQRGDTLYSIARRYGVSVQAIVNANGIANPNFIWVGQRLRIPTGSQPPSAGANYITYVVKRGDYLASIAVRYGVTVNAIVRANGLRNPNLIYVGQRLLIPATAQPKPCAYSSHVVARGETLASIAYQYGVNMWDIVAANGLSNPNVIYPGLRLIIPCATRFPQPKPAPVPGVTPSPPVTYPPYYPPVAAWSARIVSNTNKDEPVPGVGSILQVSVEGKVGLTVTVSLDGFYHTASRTGTKPNIGPYACEFAPLQSGVWTITPEGLGTEFKIFLDGSGTAHVVFYQSGTFYQPTPKPGQPVVTPLPPVVTAIPPVTGKMRSPAYGMQAFLWYRPEVADRDLQLIQQAGFGWVKQVFSWREIEGAGKGQFDWSRADRVVNDVQRYGLRLVARVDAQPQWAGGGYPTVGPPNNMQDYADFVRRLAQRYKGRIHAYEIWNEPNLAREWGNRPPNPAGYTNMLKQAYNAIKSVDPNALVFSAGMAPTTRWDNVAMPDTEFIKGMYDAGVKGFFDALGVNAPGYKAPPDLDPGVVANDPNWYNRGDPNCPGPRCRVYCFRHVEDVRQIMVNRGDGNRQIAILEFGWTSDPRAGSPYHWFAVSQDQKADYLVGAYGYAKAHWAPWIGLMSLIYMPNPDWTQNDEQYWWSIIEPSYPELHLLPAYVELKNMPK